MKAITSRKLGHVPVDHPKSVIATLPDDWVNRVVKIQYDITRAQPESNRGDSLEALCISIASGCTPGELERGVLIKALDSTTIILGVWSPTYQTSRNTESLRVLRLTDLQRNGATQLLQNFYCSNSRLNKQATFSYKANRLQKLCKNLGEQLRLSTRKNQQNLSLSPVLFRHQLFAEAYKTGLYDELEMMQILGLKSSSSLQSYATQTKVKTPTSKFINFQEIVHRKREERHEG